MGNKLYSADTHAHGERSTRKPTPADESGSPITHKGLRGRRRSGKTPEGGGQHA